ncbi:MAG: hypothetical protein HPY66_2576 [Firmicutes bacterium]|nr:hypothetical protein [Bacillota bacterium]MDI6705034.1 hypothetical protein [Bacillota bacterium]
MKEIVLRILRLFLGLFLFAVGIVMTINANLGLAPWDVFHQGISNKIGITMGQASIAVGVLLVILNGVLGERLGWGTLCNMVFVGLFLDFLMLNQLIPVFESIILRLVMMALGLFVIGVASYFYIGAGLGSGPRDGLMIAFTKKTGRSVRLIRNSIETSVLVMGYILGGFVGIGTLIMALTVGHFVQFAFKILNFDVNTVEHRFIDEDIKLLRRMLSKSKTDADAN